MDTLDGGLGNDTLVGGSGLDTVTYAWATGAITINLGLTTAQATGAAGHGCRPGHRERHRRLGAMMS